MNWMASHSLIDFPDKRCRNHPCKCGWLVALRKYVRDSYLLTMQYPNSWTTSSENMKLEQQDRTKLELSLTCLSHIYGWICDERPSSPSWKKLRTMQKGR